MMSTRQGYLRAVEPPSHFMMQSFRVGGSLRKSLARTAVDRIIKNGGWKTESIAEQYIGVTSSGQVYGSKRSGGKSLSFIFTHPPEDKKKKK